MTFDQAVFGVLSANSSVAAIVAGKIFPVALQRGITAPYLVFTRTKNEDFRTHDGLPSIEGMTVAVACYAKTPSSADLLSEAVQAAMLPLKGEAPTASGFYWESVLHGSIADVYQPEDYLYCVELTFEVMYRI